MRAGRTNLEEKVFVDSVDVLLLLGKNQHRRRRLLQTLKQVNSPRLLLHVFNFLDDVHGRCAGSAHVDRDGAHEGGTGKVLNLLRHRGREEERLTLGLEVGEDGTDVFLEAHVDHAIGLVHADVAANVEGENLLVEEVHEAAGSCHCCVHARSRQKIKSRPLLKALNIQHMNPITNLRSFLSCFVSIPISESY